MNKNIQLLDCTLRDGGYVNDWKFGHSNIISIFKRLADTNVDFIEIGFLDDRRPFDKDRSIMPNTKSVDKIYGKLDKKNSLIVGMIDYGTCSIENISPANESCIDAIRVIFKKGKMHEAMDFCKQVKKLGYKVFSQLVSITSYEQEDFEEIIKLVNEVKPYAVSIVDTYGLLDNKWLLSIFKILDDNVMDGIKIGYHAHNNFQLAYSNCLALINCETKHEILVDGSLYGMGKSAGNAPIELVAMAINNINNNKYNISPMLEAINESIVEFYKTSPWGYKPFFYMVAKNQCHPSYLSDFEKKDNLSITMLDSLLAKIEPKEKKLLYDKQLGEQIYNSFVQENTNDELTLKKLTSVFSKNNILLIGPGKNIVLQENYVKKFISNNKPTIISINYLPEGIEVDYVFITKEYRYKEMLEKLYDISDSCIRTIALTNISPVNGAFDYVINREPLLEKKETIKDNSFLMMLELLTKIGVKKVYCAGFDGYSDKDNNYFNPNMEYSFIKSQASSLNSHISEKIKYYKTKLDIDFITFSEYTKENDINGGAF